MFWSSIVKANTLLFAVVISIVVAMTASLGYLMFYMVPAHDMASKLIRVLTIGSIDVLYVWFMWSHRGEKKFAHHAN
jgi:uncharacterized membrane protein